MLNGLINLYKPSGMSSAQAVGKVKRIFSPLGEKTVGHMGTLDPMAEGVLIVGVGKAARLFDYLSGHRKQYIAKFKFGYETDTLDRTGKTVRTTSDIPSIDAVGHALQSLVGKIEQVPPAYSAKHVDGKRAYDLARRGESVELKPVSVEIFGIEIICQPRMDEVAVMIDCSSGTYIRSICRDVGRMCGSLATLEYLQRTKVGSFGVESATTIENLEIVKDGALIPCETVIDLPRYDVMPESKSDLDNGRKIPFSEKGEYKIFCADEFYGIGREKDGVLKITTYLKD